MPPIQSLGCRDVTLKSPRSTVRAARGHARLRYAGGSWRWSQPAKVDEREPGRRCHRELVTCHLGKRRHVQARKDADRQRHIGARLLDVLGERGVIVVDGMLVNFSVGMPMNNDVTMHPIMRMAENEAEIVVARVSCRRFRRSDEHTLQRHGYRRRHHEDDGDASEQGLSREAQNCRPFGKPGGPIP